MKHLHAHINPFELEALEPRIMLSGDAAEAMVGGSGSLAQEVIQGSGDVQQEDTLIPISGEQEDGADSGQQPDLFGTVIDYQEPMGDEGGTTVLMIDGGSIQDGETLIATEVNIGDSVWSGDNRVIADRLTISGTMTATPGARLTLMPTGKDASIWLGGKDDGFSLSANELELLSTAGFEEVVIGHEDGGHDMTLTSLSYKGNLTLRTPADGGAFYTEGPISHSEGELNFIGSGHTAFTNDDTITEGTALNVDDTVQLVYTVDNENEFLLDTTGGGTHAQGNDIVISGDIRGTSEGLGGTLYLNAGTQGNIFIGNSEDPDPETTGNIGTSAKLERIIILNAADVTILGNIRVDVFIQQDGTGDTVLGSGLSNFVRIESGLLDITTDGNVTVSGDLEVLEGDVDISITGASTAAQFQVAGASDVDGDFTIHRAGKVLMKGNVTVSGHMSQGIGLSDSRFESDVSVGSMSLRADTRIHFLNDLTLTQGDLTLVTNNIDFNGGVSSVTGALDTNDLSISNAYFRPIAANLNMNIGAPLGATTMFPFTTTDIAALSDGFVSITFGYDSGSTNTARIGTAAFKDPVTVYAGTILVNGNHSARKALTLEAATGDITITNGALVRVQNEQINNVWGSSDLTLTADVGDVLFNNGAYLQIENDDDADLSQGSAITIVSTLGQVRDQSATANFQTARDLDVTAAGDIYLFTDIENLWAESTVAGDIELFELDGLHIYEAITANGAIRVDTGGLTRVDLASSLTDASLNTITVSALGDIEAGKILAGTLGNVTLTSEGQIRRVDGLAAIDHLVQANELELNSEDGVGLASIPLLIETNGLAVANTLTGLIRIEQVAGRDTMGVSILQDASGNGDMVSLLVDVVNAVTLRTAGIHSASTAGIFLSVFSDLIVNGDITSQGGSVTVLAETDATFTSGVALESNGGDVLIESGRSALGDLTLAVDAAVRSLGGNLLVAVSQNTTLGILDARSSDLLDSASWGHVDLQIGGWLRDYDDSATVNLFANALKIVTETGIGQLPILGSEQSVEIDAALLSASTATAGVIALAEQNDLTVGTVGLLPANLILVDGSSFSHAGFAARTAIVNTNGDDILLSSAAGLFLETEVAVQTQGGGRIALIAGSLVVEGDIRSQGGDISLRVTGEVEVNTGAVIQTSGSGSIALQSSIASLLSEADTLFTTGSGAIVLQAQNDITLGQVQSTGAVGVTSVTGSLRSAVGGLDDRIVVSSDTLALVVGDLLNGPASTAELFHTSVNTLSLTGGAGSVYRIENDQTLTIDTTSAVADLYNTLMVAGDLEVIAQSDVEVSGEGDIELIVRGDAVLAGTREISTTGVGQIDVTADGFFSMGELALITNETGTIGLTAQDTVSVGRIHSDTGTITVESLSASIVDSDPTQLLVLDFETTGQLDLIAVTGIGIESSLRYPITVDLGILRAETATGGIFMTSPNGFTTNGILTTDGTAPVSLLSAGTLTLGPNAGGVAISATGDIVLQAGVDIVQLVDSSITAGSDISMRANDGNGDMTLFSVTADSGSVALSAGGAVLGIASPVLPAITAQGLLLDDVGSFGVPGQRVRTQISRLAGSVDGGTLAFNNLIDLSLDTVAVITTEPTQTGLLDPLPTVTQTSDRLQVGGASGDGVFAVVTGLLTVTAADAGLSTLTVDDALPVLWQSSLTQTWNGWFDLDGGDLTLRSNQNLALNGTTTSTTAGGSVAIEVTGNVSTGAITALNLGSGDLVANVGESATLDGQWITTGAIAIVAGDSILAGIDSAAVRITASDLLLDAGSAVGAEDAFLITAVSRLAASAGYAGVHIENSGDLRVTNLGWTVPSLQPNANVNLIFSGYLGGVKTTQSGAISLMNDGTVIVDPVAARIHAFADESFQMAVLADETGTESNELTVLFDVTNAVVAIETEFDAEQGLLRIRIPQGGGLSVMDVINAINADPDFPAAAILSGGLVDGAQPFIISAGGEDQFEAEGGSFEGIETQVYGSTGGGEEPIAALATIQPLEEQYTIRIRALNPGEAANSFTVRILDEGPDTELIDGLDIAIVEWDELNEVLNLYVNYGYTTFDTLVRTINQGTDPLTSPFTADFSGSYSAANDAADIIGDASVFMESSLFAEASLRPLGVNNDIRVVADGSGGLYNGIQFRFIDDGLTPTQGVRATFDPGTNIFSVFIQSRVSTANQVVTAINNQGVFSASLISELTSFNNGTGSIQASRFLLAGGAVGVAATTRLEMIGSNNNLILTADELGDDENGILTRVVVDSGLGLGEATAEYITLDRVLLLTISPSGASAGAVIEAINLGPNAGSIPLTASLPPAETGTGTLTVNSYPLTSGGTGAFAQATLDGAGDNNTIFFEADQDIPSLVDITVRIIDDGTITDGTATVTYTDSPRRLLINMQAGITTAQTIINTLNADAGIEITGYNAGGSDGSGTFGLVASSFVGGVDPQIPALTLTLPSGLVLELVSTLNWQDTNLVGGIAENGIEVTLAVDDAMASGTVAVERLEIDNRRILFIRVADAAATVQDLHDALVNSSVNFEIGNRMDVAAESLLALAPVLVEGVESFNEGSIRVQSNGDMQLIGRVESATGRVELATTAGDLSLDSAEARIFAVDGVELAIAGSFANRASLESIQVLVYDQAELFIETGSQALLSTESLALRGHGDILITGSGLAMEDGFEAERVFSMEADGEITVDAPIRSVPAAVTANGLVFELVKSLVDGEGALLSEALRPVSISEELGTYTIYALPGVATHADIIDAINALELNDLNLFFASLGRQEGLLRMGDFSFYLTVLEGEVVNNVTVEFAELTEGNALAGFANGTLTLQLSHLDNSTAADVLAALNALDVLTATSTDAVLTGFSRGTEARDFDSDYSIEIVPDATLPVGTPVVLSEVDGVFTLRALPGVATRLDLRTALIDSGLFGVLIPAQTARLTVDGIDYFLNTGVDTVSAVDLEFRFVDQQATLPGLIDLSVTAGTLSIALDIFNPTTAADLQTALESFGYTVFTTAADLDLAFDEATTSATLEAIAANASAAALTLGETITVTLPVATNGVFATTRIDVEGVLLLINWALPTVDFTYDLLTAPENRSVDVIDDAAAPQATFSAGSNGVFSSTVLVVDGVDISIRARSAELTLLAGGGITVTDNGLVGGGVVHLDAGNEVVIDGVLEGGPIDVRAEAAITQTGVIQSVGTGEIRVESNTATISMSDPALTTSESGDILYEAPGNITLTFIGSTDSARIDIVSGASLLDSNALTSNGLNLSTAGLVTLTAQTGIGAILDADPLPAEVGDLKTAAGTLRLRNLGATGDIVITQVAAGGDLDLIEITQNAVSGWSILIVENGNLTLRGPVTHTSDGSLVLGVNGNLVVEDQINLQGGHISIDVLGDVNIEDDVNTDGGDVSVSASGFISMHPLMTLDASGGNVLLQATGHVVVSAVQTVDGDVRIESTGASILRSAADGRTNVTARTLQLEAALAIGTLADAAEAITTEVGHLNATAGNGVLAVSEVDELTIGSSSITLAFAQIDKITVSGTWQETQFMTGNGDAVLKTGGTLEIQSEIVSTLSIDGHLHIEVSDTTEDSDGDLLVNGDISVDGGTLLLEVDGLITQDAASVISVVDQDSILAAGASINLSRIEIGTGAVALTAGGAITRVTGAPAVQIVARDLRLESGADIGAVNAAISFDTDTLSASAPGSIHLNGASSVAVTEVEVSALIPTQIPAQVNPAFRTEAALADLTSTNGGNILMQILGRLELVDGDSDILAVSTVQNGHIFLKATNLDVYATIQSVSGYQTLDITQVAEWHRADESAPDAGDGYTGQNLSQAGEVHITAVQGITMQDLTVIRSSEGNVRLNSDGSIRLGRVEASIGLVALRSLNQILDNGDGELDVIADRLHLISELGVGTLGASYNALDTRVNRLAALLVSGPFAVDNTGAVEIGEIVDETVGTVNLSGVPGSVSVRDWNGIQSFDELGNGVSLTASGNITVLNDTTIDPGIRAAALGSGNLYLAATGAGSTLTLSDDLIAAAGHITLLADGLILMDTNVSVETFGPGTLTVDSANGGFTQNTGATLAAQNGNVLVKALGTVQLSGITTNGSVAVISLTGAILDNEPARVNVEANALRLNAALNIATGANPLNVDVVNISAATADGGLFVRGDTSLTVTSVQVITQQVAVNATVAPITAAAQTGLSTGGASGGIVVRAMGGNLIVAAANAVTATGTGHILLEASVNVVINETVSSDTGTITLLSGANMTIAAGVIVSTTSVGEIQAFSGGTLITGANSRFVAATGNVVVAAAGNIVLGGILTEGKAAVGSAGGTIRGAGSTDFTVEVQADHLILAAPLGGVGTLSPASPVRIFRTRVNRVSAVAGPVGLNVVNEIALEVNSVEVGASRVTPLGTLQALPAETLTNLTTTSGNGSIVLQTLSGTLTLNQLVSTHGSGNLRLDAADNLIVNAPVVSTTGHLTLRAANTLTLNAGAQISTTTPGTILLLADAGAISMNALASITATSSAARLQAETNITLGSITADHLSLIADTGSILRATGSLMNLTATNLRIHAQATVGSPSAHLTTAVNLLSVISSTGSIYITEADDVSIGETAVTTQEVNLNASLNPVVDAPQSGLVTGVNGNIVLTSGAGSLTVVPGAMVSANGTGNIRLEAATQLLLSEHLSSGTGHITLLAGNGLTVSETIVISTFSSGSVYADAGSGALTLPAAGGISAPGGPVRLGADGEISVGSVAGQNVWIRSESGSILPVGAAPVNISTGSLLLWSGDQIATGPTPLRITANTLSAHSVNGTYLMETDNLTVNQVFFQVILVGANGVAGSLSPAAQSDLRTTANGDIVLVSDTGSITLRDGNANLASVSAGGSGSVLLKASTSIIANANAGVFSGTGNLALKAGTSLQLGEMTVQTAGTGDISLEAAGGNLVMNGQTVISTPAASIRVIGNGDVLLGNLTGESVSVTSETSFIANPLFTTRNITAANVRLYAANEIGLLTRRITLDAGVLTAHSATGGLFLSELNSVSVGEVDLSVNEIDENGLPTSEADAAQAGLLTHANGNINLLASSGTVSSVLTDGLISAHGSGEVRIVAAAFDLEGDVGSTTGLITLRSTTGSLEFSGLISTTGHISLRSAAALLGGRVEANMARLFAQVSIGTLLQPLEVDVNTLAAESVTGGIYLQALTDMTLGAVNVDGLPEVDALTAATEIVLFSEASVFSGGTTPEFTAPDVQLDLVGSAGTALTPINLDTDTLAARSETGDLFLVSIGDLEVGTLNGQSGLSALDGSIYVGVEGQLALSEDIVATEDVSVFATADILMAEGTAVSSLGLRIASLTDLDLGNLSAETVSLVSGQSIVYADVTALALRMHADSNIGSELNPVHTHVDQLEAVSENGAVFITESAGASLSTVTVVSLEYDSVSHSFITVTDTGVHGISALTGITLVVEDGKLLDGGDLEDDLRTVGTVRVTGANGLGTTGSGALEVSAPFLQAATSLDGSVYLHLNRDTELGSLLLAGTGNLYLTVDGNLDSSGDFTLTNGSAFVTVAGDIDISGTLIASRDLRITGRQLLLTATGSVLTQTGNLDLRGENLTMTIGSRLEASARNLSLTITGNATLALLQVGRTADLRVGSLTGLSGLRSEHEVRAPALRVIAAGTINGLLTDVDRIDVRAGSEVIISEADDLEVGRYGLRLVNALPEDNFVLEMVGSELGGLGGLVRVTGEGRMVLQSDDVITLNARIVSQGGTGAITLAVNSLILPTGFTDAMVETLFGEVYLDLQNGVGDHDTESFTVLAGTFTAHSTEGKLDLVFLGDVEITPEGVRLETGSGRIDLRMQEGDLSLMGRIVNTATGDVNLDVVQGRIQVDLTGIAGPVVETDGNLNLYVDEGVDVSGGSHLSLRAARHDVVSREGNLPVELSTGAGPVHVDRVELLQGAGSLNLRVLGGLMSMNATSVVGNSGTGDTYIFGEAGIEMTLGSLIHNSAGRLDIRFNNDFRVARIESFGNATYIEGFFGSVRIVNGLVGAHMLTNNTHEPLFKLIREQGIYGLRVDVDLVRIEDDVVNYTSRSRNSSGFVDFGNPFLIL